MAFLTESNIEFLFNILRDHVSDYALRDLLKIMVEVHRNFKNKTPNEKNKLVLTYAKGRIHERQRKFDVPSIFDDNFNTIPNRGTDTNILVKENIEDVRDFLLVKKDFTPRGNIQEISYDPNDIRVDLPEEFSNYHTSLFNQLITTQKVIIDSRDINHDLQDPSNFTIHLPNFKNVISVKMKECTIPSSDYIINTSNNLLHFKESTGGDDELVATITEGNYTATELAAELQIQLNEVGDSNYTVVTNNYKTLIEYDASRVTTNFGTAVNVFDDDYDNYWQSNSNSGYIIYDFGSGTANKQNVQKYSMLYSETLDYPRDWTIEISNDLVNWTVIDTQSGQTLTQYQTKEYTITNHISARYVKLNITDSSAGGNVHLSLLNYFQETDDDYINITSDLTGGDNIFELILQGDDAKYGEDRFITTYKPNSIGEILGFNPSDLTTNKTYIGQNKINLEAFEYIFMAIGGINPVRTAINQNNFDDIFSKIYLNTDKNTYKLYKNRFAYVDYLDFKGPVKVEKLNVAFYHKNGTLYDFRGYPFDIMFEFKILNF